MARQRVSTVWLAKATGVSRNYIGKRLRDEVSFTLNDVEAICAALGEGLAEFLVTAARDIHKH
jgi:transcriptional regulator with XRE-family HTH domain